MMIAVNQMTLFPQERETPKSTPKAEYRMKRTRRMMMTNPTDKAAMRELERAIYADRRSTKAPKTVTSM